MLLKATLVVPEKLLPKMVTMVPSGPVVGEKEVMMGGAVMVTSKSVSLSSKPSALVTLIGPEEAPEGTEAVSSEDEMMAKEAAGVLLKATLVVPEKLLPKMVTMVPSGPVVGEKEVMMGGAVMVTSKSVSLSSKPSALVTLIGPEEAPEGTEAVSSEDEMMAKEAAGVLLKATLVVPEKLLPKMVTMVPSGPVVGEKEVMMGGAVMVTSKSVSLSSKPSALVTLIGPEEAPEGTEAVSSEDEMMAKEAAGVLLKATLVVPEKLLPKMVTMVPSGTGGGGEGGDDGRSGDGDVEVGIAVIEAIGIGDPDRAGGGTGGDGSGQFGG